MFCAISGKLPSIPVLSLISKCIFEKSLIEQYIDEYGIDPITKTSLTKEDLIVLDQTVQNISLINSLNSPTLNSNYSIPNLLNTLRGEWDAIMLENFELRTQLDISKKELSKALYKCDAAIRVAAKASQERDELRHTLTKLTETFGSQNINESINEHVSDQDKVENLPTDLIETFVAQSQEYVKATKHLSKTKALEAKSFIKDNESEVGIVSIDFDRIYTNRLLDAQGRQTCVGDAKGFNLVDNNSVIKLVDLPTDVDLVYPLGLDRVLYITDKSIGIFNVKTKELNSFGKSDERKIICVQYSPKIGSDFFLSLDADGLIYLSSLDGLKTYKLLNLRQYSPKKGFPSNIELHKDGLLVATQLNDTDLAIFSISSLTQSPTIIKVQLQVPNSTIISYRFAPNGYWLYVFSTHEFIVYDLRKKPGTLAMNRLLIEDTDLIHFETDATGKTLFLQGSASISSYSYLKSKGGWISGPIYELDAKIDYMYSFYEDGADKFLRFFHILNSDSKEIIPSRLKIV